MPLALYFMFREEAGVCRERAAQFGRYLQKVGHLGSLENLGVRAVSRQVRNCGEGAEAMRQVTPPKRPAWAWPRPSSTRLS